MFSLITPIASVTSVERAGVTSFAPVAMISSVSLSPKAMNFSFLDTKSVSQLSSRMTALFPLIFVKILPSLVALALRFAAAARPFSLRIFTACSILPSASMRAFLQSPIPAPVFSLRFLTSIGLISISVLLICPRTCPRRFRTCSLPLPACPLPSLLEHSWSNPRL